MYRQIIPTGRLVPSDAAAIVLFEKTTTLPAGYADLDRQAGGAISAALKRSEFNAGKGTVTTLYPGAPGVSHLSGTRLARVFILGLGDREKFTNEALRIAAARLLRAASAAKVQQLILRVVPGLESKLDAKVAGRAIGDGLAISNFEFEQFKGAAKGDKNKKPKTPTKPVDLTVHVEPSLRESIERSLTIGDSVSITRTLAATPPNVANPQYLCEFAKKMAKEVGLKCTIIDARRAKQLSMGGLLGVGSAGSTPPAMIILEWQGGGFRVQGSGAKTRRPANSSSSSSLNPEPRTLPRPLLLVGKAVTFDTGGISIKPADSMDKMKYDKCGGMAVIGAMHAIARLKLPTRVVGIIPAAENMLSEKAYRPGDILTHHNGVTSEIINTDAEGRLILADALSYGTATYKPRGVIDLATLTGACVVALGSVCAGAFCGDGPFRSHLFDAAEFTGERLWHMPLWDEHRQQIKGTHGDILNAGGREAGASTAAAFLSFFVGAEAPRKLPTVPWCHLDIAGVADVKGDTPLFAKGPTGFGVRLLVRAVETWK